ncbi:MAG TPA: hypothetical protein VFR94_07015 [Nitrososphaeraceae archaeon]|nr:hypothetical protein [Nitrososphaeraceae archaeon]
MNSQILFVTIIVTTGGLATAVLDSAIISTISAQDNTTMSIIGNLTTANMTSNNMTEGIVVTGGEGGNSSGSGLQ